MVLKALLLKTVNIIESLASYSQTDAISLGSTSNTITLKTNSLSRLTIKNDGMIGIGTTSPVTPLTIHDAGEIGGNYKSHLLIMDKTAYNQSLNGGSILFGGLKNSTESGYWSKISGEKANTTLDNTSGVLKFWTRSGSTAPQQRMIIDAGGDLGINITNPTSKLHVGGDINTTGSYKINGTALATEDLTNNSGFITASASNTLTNKLVIKHDTNAPYPNSDDVGLLVTNVTDNTEDAVITIRGSRNGSLTAKTSQLRFENLDNNPAPTMIKTLGAICSVVTDFTSNIGSLKFYTFSNGFTESVCMEMKSNNDIAITSSATIGSNLAVTGSATIGGTLTCGSYSGLPIGTGGTLGVVSAGDGLTVSAGQLSTKPIRLLVGQFNHNASINFNSPSRWITWDTTVNNNGIQHTNSTIVPNGSLFTVNETGVYHINVLLRVQGVGGRHGLVLDLYTMTGTNPSVRPSSYDAIYGLANGYCRASQSSTNRVDLVGSITLVLENGQQFEIIGRCAYNTNTSAVNTLTSGSFVRIERMK